MKNISKKVKFCIFTFTFETILQIYGTGWYLPSFITNIRFYFHAPCYTHLHLCTSPFFCKTTSSPCSLYLFTSSTPTLRQPPIPTQPVVFSSQPLRPILLIYDSFAKPKSAPLPACGPDINQDNSDGRRWCGDGWSSPESKTLTVIEDSPAYVPDDDDGRRWRRRNRSEIDGREDGRGKKEEMNEEDYSRIIAKLL